MIGIVRSARAGLHITIRSIDASLMLGTRGRDRP